ncbi:uncharacterized protein CEXT_317301 [Caerostris extrusa]|uniref:Uncharacterized protein n=1 Tax=Caerostris extrusa TaxID=172846 RepID=A0AAV4MY10_CAEEX|nr:uncharacterized protein CEXT_317301 [Caerostris extrusa]
MSFIILASWDFSSFLFLGVKTEEEYTTEDEFSTEDEFTTEYEYSTEDFCVPPEGALAQIECPMNTLLQRPRISGRYLTVKMYYVIHSFYVAANPRFSEMHCPKCYDFKETLYDEDQGDVYIFFSVDNGITLNAQCPGEYDVIVKYSMCVVDGHVSFVELHCSPIKDTGRVIEIFNVTSADMKDSLVNCGDNAGFRKYYSQMPMEAELSPG